MIIANNEQTKNAFLVLMDYRLIGFEVELINLNKKRNRSIVCQKALCKHCSSVFA
jgi:hypothetical protein